MTWLDGPAFTAGHTLDGLASGVFAGETGRARIEPLLARFAQEVGTVHDDDDDADLLRIIRADWALCDAEIGSDGEESIGLPGDTWAHRAATGQLAEVPAEPAFSRAAASYAGLFEVWPGRPTWVRDLWSGRCERIVDALAALPKPDTEPAALWELRIIPVAGGARICRPPLWYPPALGEHLLQGLGDRARDSPPLGMQTIRRARLQWTRARKRIDITTRMGDLSGARRR